MNLSFFLRSFHALSVTLRAIRSRPPPLHKVQPSSADVNRQLISDVLITNSSVEDRRTTSSQPPEGEPSDLAKPDGVECQR